MAVTSLSSTLSAARRGGRGKAAVALAALVAVSGLAATSLPASAVNQPADTLVQAKPKGKTPHVLDGQVLAIAQVGNTIVLGGQFTTARNDGDTTSLSRANLLAFDATTGAISTTFVPNPNGRVEAVVPSGDGTSIFVGGQFSSIGGVSRSRVARIQVSNGAVLPFNAGAINAVVRDLKVVGSRLWIAGLFSKVKGNAQPALATVNATTGAFDPYMSAKIAGVHNKGTTNVIKFDVTPDGSRLVAVGNFRTVDGQTRNQVLQLDLTATRAVPASWQTTFYSAPCASRAFDSYMRDVDLSPDGSFFVISTTGGYGGADAPCDTTARFETGASGTGIQPSWVNTTGGDTTYAVEIGQGVVYVGGHFRWQNNPYASDSAGKGAVDRKGLAALDPSNGLPYSWNPGRTRGVGVFDFLLTSQGLWFGSDTDRVAQILKSRIALMPVGGSPIAAIQSPSLPNDVYVAGQNGQTINKRSLTDAGDEGPLTAVGAGGVNWDTVRGAFMIGGQLYLAHSDGTMTRRSFDGTTYGAPTAVNTGDLLAVNTDWRSDIQNATGMFFDNGRIYFTRSGSTQLFYRYFTPESGVVGAKRLVASNGVTGVNFSQVRGMFQTGNRLFFATSNGALYRADWQHGAAAGSPVTGTATQVSGPGRDTALWNARALFVHQG